jgi:hypothetical protein
MEVPLRRLLSIQVISVLAASPYLQVGWQKFLVRYVISIFLQALKMETLSNTTSSLASGWMSCFYINATSTIQIVRVADDETWHLERVVLPGLHIVFHAPEDSFFEIYSSDMATGVLADRIPCIQLACTEKDGSSSLDMLNCSTMT